MNGVTTFFNPTFLLLIGFFVLIYFLMIRPQNKAKKAHEEMVNGIEVGDEVAEKFPDDFVDRTSYSKPHIDIKKYIEFQLLRAGILEENIEIHGSCTFSDSEFFSYRRDGKRSGRMMVIIKLNT